jgi:RNA polymerase sigma-70 factor (ECF subfamily)
VDELAFARALAAGDEDAFARFVDQQTGPVFRLCYRILGSVDEAEDAVQETFVLAYRARATYRGDGPAGAWLARIAARESWRRGRSRSRLRAATTPLGDVLHATLADSTDLAGEAIASEERDDVRRAVAALPEPYAEVVAMRFFAELSLADIASAIGRPEATVKTQLYRGLARLRDIVRTERP